VRPTRGETVANHVPAQNPNRAASKARNVGL
jgi:hypothetical protein